MGGRNVTILRSILARVPARLAGLGLGLACLGAAPQDLDLDLDRKAAFDARTDQPSFGASDPVSRNGRPRNANAPGEEPSTDQIGRGNPLWAIPFASFTATRERPIFSPSRRPPAAAVVVNPAPAKTEPPPIVKEIPLLSLLGAIAGDADGIAIFLDETTKSIVRLKTGEAHSGWILRSVRGREAILEKNRETAVLAIATALAN